MGREIMNSRTCPHCKKIMEIKEQVLEPDNSISKEWISYICEDCLYFICENVKTGEIMRPTNEEMR